MKKPVYIVLLAVAIGVLLLRLSLIPLETPAQTWFGQRCIGSFEEFAFFPWRLDQVNEVSEPSFAKQIALPETEADTANVQLLGIRDGIHGKEIWISRWVSGGQGTLIVDYLIFLPGRSEWRKVLFPLLVQPYSFANFTSANGDMWTVYTENSYREEEVEVKIAKYNEQRNVFDIVASLALPYFYGPLIQFDSEGEVFYFFQPNETVYSFSLATQTLRELKSIRDFDVVEVASTSGGFYLLGPGQSQWLGSEQLRYVSLDDETVSIISGNLIPVPGNVFVDQVSGSLFVDDEATLWMGIYARYSSKGWSVTHPSRLSYFLSDFRDANFSFGSPHVIAEIDGMFIIQRDWGRRTSMGTAIYDPDTQLGCWFTHRVGSIMQDAVGNIWFLAEGMLYMQNFPADIP
jgi:hypothetical protein